MKAFWLVLFALATSTAYANNIQVNFDETGAGTWQDSGSASINGYSGTSGTLNFTVASDPTGLVAGNVLIYFLPELVTSTIFDIGEPGDTLGIGDANASDVLAFTDASGTIDGINDASIMILYSSDIAGGLAADTGLPAAFATYLDQANENISGNFQYLDGGAFTAGGNEYNGLSGAAPEPTTMSMIALGLAGALGFARRRMAVKQ